MDSRYPAIISSGMSKTGSLQDGVQLAETLGTAGKVKKKLLFCSNFVCM
ncbi:unnamed protein product [Brassica oleracea]|uniref:(rape) hypothetical protein n=1 Tax=Brassica napus TaxID=3708 RepID=A0A816MMB4_BRANA|nr:unnamed protein product [Brassica napus]